MAVNSLMTVHSLVVRCMEYDIWSCHIWLLPVSEDIQYLEEKLTVAKGGSSCYRESIGGT